jgi:hypothetical protein
MKIKVNFGNLARQATGNDGAPQFQISFGDQAADKKRKRGEEPTDGEQGQAAAAGGATRASGRTGPKLPSTGPKLKLPAAPSPFAGGQAPRGAPTLPIGQQGTPRLPAHNPAHNGSTPSTAPSTGRSTPQLPLFGRTPKPPLSSAASAARPPGSLPPAASGKFKVKLPGATPGSAASAAPKFRLGPRPESARQQETLAAQLPTPRFPKAGGGGGATPIFASKGTPALPPAYGGTPRGPPSHLRPPQPPSALASTPQLPQQRSTFKMKSFLDSTPSSSAPQPPLAPKVPRAGSSQALFATPGTQPPPAKRQRQEPPGSPLHSLGPPRPSTSLASLDTRGGSSLRKVKVKAAYTPAASQPARSDSYTLGSPTHTGGTYRTYRDMDGTPDDSGQSVPRRRRRAHSPSASDDSQHPMGAVARAMLASQQERQREERAAGGPAPALAPAPAPAPAAAKPTGPPKPAQLQMLVEKMQARDKNNIFRDPVTEAVVRRRPPRTSSATAPPGRRWPRLPGNGLWLTTAPSPSTSTQHPAPAPTPPHTPAPPPGPCAGARLLWRHHSPHGLLQHQAQAHRRAVRRVG